MHYYKRNIGNYAKRTSRLTLLQHGVYTLLLDACYDREAFPTEEQAVQWLWASSAEEVEAIKFVLNRYFIKSGDGTFTHDDVLADLLEYHAMADRNKQIAIDRETRRKQLSTSRARSVNASSRDMHESPPNQEPRTNNQEQETLKQENTRSRANAPKVAPPTDVDQQTWNDWVTLRKTKRASVTQTAIDQARIEAEKAGMTLEAFLKIWCARGSQGLSASWLKPDERTAKHRKHSGFETMDYREGVNADGTLA
jgi:uncharacterized protein YdaU (DUF1376 family)